MSILGTISQSYQIGRHLNPDHSMRSALHQSFVLIQTIFNFNAVQSWLNVPKDSLTGKAIKRFESMHGSIYLPYINRYWPTKRRLETITGHYRMLEGKAAIIAHATLENVEIARLDDHFAGLRIVLRKSKWFIREGEAVIDLFVNDKRYYSIAFTLGTYADQPLAMIGTIQGVHSDEAADVYRELTHALHGMRPRDFLFKIFQMFCNELDIHKIWGVSNECQQIRSLVYGYSYKAKMFANLDEVWKEHGGQEMGNGFFDIPVSVTRKDISEVPSRKRAAYRRRFEMLDQLEMAIGSACKKYESISLGTPDVSVEAGDVNIGQRIIVGIPCALGSLASISCMLDSYSQIFI